MRGGLAAECGCKALANIPKVVREKLAHQQTFWLRVHLQNYMAITITLRYSLAMRTLILLMVTGSAMSEFKSNTPRL